MPQPPTSRASRRASRPTLLTLLLWVVVGLAVLGVVPTSGRAMAGHLVDDPMASHDAGPTVAALTSTPLTHDLALLDESDPEDGEVESTDGGRALPPPSHTPLEPPTTTALARQLTPPVQVLLARQLELSLAARGPPSEAPSA